MFRVVDFIVIVRSFWEGGYFSISTHVCFVVAVFCVLVSAMSLYSLESSVQRNPACGGEQKQGHAGQIPNSVDFCIFCLNCVFSIRSACVASVWPQEAVLVSARSRPRAAESVFM